MNDKYRKLKRCADCVRAVTDFKPLVGLVLGSGLGGFADDMDIVASVDYSDIGGFPVSTVPGHKGRFVFGYVSGVPVVAMQGRVHFYEGYDMENVVLPIRLMGILGAKALILTNAAGGVNFDFSAGDLMLITDHISALVPSPLAGSNIDEIGVRFPDMSKVYDPVLQEAVKSVAKKEGILLREGVYTQFPGPRFETPAEIRMLRMWGTDAVGMSTACEAQAANHMGMRICGISCISNLACGMTDQPLTHEEVQEAADKAAPEFKKLISGSIAAIGELLG